MTYRVIEGDCVEAMAAMDEASVDAIVTDPPYGLEFMGKEWDRLGDSGRLTHRGPVDDKASPRGRHAVAYNGSQNQKCRRCGRWTYDHEGRRCECPTPDIDRARQSRVMQEWHYAWAAQALRVLKPGGHLLAFGGTRTFHRLTCALEDAGFEIRDCLSWLYGSGFPKSLDVSKAIDKAAGAERTERTGVKPGHELFVGKDNVKSMREGTLSQAGGFKRPWMDDPERVEAAHWETAPVTAEAQRWQGWGTALKPAWEPVVLARKPTQGTVAANVTRYGTGAINVDGCRIETDDGDYDHGGNTNANPRTKQHGSNSFNYITAQMPPHPSGRWPANVVLGHSVDCNVEAEVPGGTTVGLGIPRWRASLAGSTPAASASTSTGCASDCPVALLDEQTGGASRFFYVAKADRAERERGVEHRTRKAVLWSSGEQSPGTFQADGTLREAANNHPTVKPVALMQWLCRLVTPPGGVVLDPFTGSGSTGIAALREGFEFIGIEREHDYVEIARDRIQGDAPLFNTEDLEVVTEE